MRKPNHPAADAAFTVIVLTAAYLVSLWLQDWFGRLSVTPMIFVLGVFLVAWQTSGYLWGILASAVGIFIVNYTFVYPYFAFNFELTQNLVTALVMLVVSVMTSALTTKIKRAEQMRAEGEMEKTRANLLRAISHDLRTPLTSIYGSTSAIIENYDSLSKTQQLKLLEEIRQDSEWLTRMVENLLSVTRIDGAKVQLIKTPTVLEELVDTTLTKFRKRHPGQRVTVSIPDEFLSIPMDAILIEQVLVNLLENAAVHAVGMTELSLTVRTERREKGRWAVFEVADDGCGIPRDRLPELFTGYLDRSDPVTDAPADGNRHNMGIGLSVCATIIRAHGGSITAENRPTGGALFRFTLALEEEDEEENHEQQQV